MAYIGIYLTALVLFLAIDAVWLSSMANRFYRAEIGVLMRDQPQWAAAAGFYVMYMLALMILVIVPQLRAGGSLLQVFGLGTVAGAMAYGTYNMTNLAVIKQWTVAVALGDWAWGALLTGVVAALTVLIARNIKGLMV
ncbi:MAG: hypothetical protein RL180_905 [Pseudomonadota bacterium]|jgi:uncharacterized membrane protein